MPVDRDSIATRLTARMDAIIAERRAARIADAEREMRLRGQFSDFWEAVELLNQHARDGLGGDLQFAGEAWDPGAGVITGGLELRGPGGQRQIAYRAQGEALQIDWPGDARARYTAANLGEAIDRLVDLAAETFAKPE